MLDKVLVLSASADAGHVRAAEAIERAFAAAGAAREVRHVDALEHTTKLLRRVYARTYLDLVNCAPELLGWLYDYMAAADLLVGKPGGLTTAEALARGLVMVIVNPIPGQEERNADHLLEEGAAIRCNNLPVLADKIDRLLGDPARLAAMRANVRRLARPRAAHDVVTALLEARRTTSIDAVGPHGDALPVGM